MRRFQFAFAFVTLIGAAQGVLFPAQVTPGNYLVSNDNTITEYDRSGVFVQQMLIPEPISTFGVMAKDIVMDRRGRIHVFVQNNEATDNTFLFTLNPDTGDWAHNTIPNWNLPGLDYKGGVSANADFVFSVEQHRGDGTGLIRVDLNDYSNVQRSDGIPFPGRDVIQVTVGLDNFVYTASPSGSVCRIDPKTFKVLEDEIFVGVGNSITGIAVASNGDIYTLALGSKLHRHDSTGKFIEAFSVTGDVDLELAADGTLLIGDYGKSFTVTNINNLDQQTVFSTAGYSNPKEPSFVTFVTGPRSLSPACSLGMAIGGNACRLKIARIW